jgi:hypothetical protein
LEEGVVEGEGDVDEAELPVLGLSVCVGVMEEADRYHVRYIDYGSGEANGKKLVLETMMACVGYKVDTYIEIKKMHCNIKTFDLR